MYGRPGFAGGKDILARESGIVNRSDQIGRFRAFPREGVFFAPDIAHTGVDIDANEGTPILAAGPGTVVSADWDLFSEVPGNISDPYGKAVVVRHDFGYKGEILYTVYAHMSEIIAVKGQHVETGDVLGLVGDTGITTGPLCTSKYVWVTIPFTAPIIPNCGRLLHKAGEPWSDA